MSWYSVVSLSNVKNQSQSPSFACPTYAPRLHFRTSPNESRAAIVQGCSAENQKTKLVPRKGRRGTTQSLSPSPRRRRTQCGARRHTNRPRAAIETFTSPFLKNANRAEWSSYLTKEITLDTPVSTCPT